MGTIQHKAVLVVSSDVVAIKDAWNKAPEPKSEVHALPQNHYMAFAVFPSGSKLGWETERAHSENLEEFCEYIGRSPEIDWIVVRFGELGRSCIECKGQGNLKKQNRKLREQNEQLRKQLAFLALRDELFDELASEYARPGPFRPEGPVVSSKPIVGDAPEGEP